MAKQTPPGRQSMVASDTRGTGKNALASMAIGLLAAALALGGCASAPTAGPRAELTVLAAASLAEAFTELGRRFEAEHPGASVSFSFAGSQQLAQQLGQGAPADVFASANSRQMEVVVQAGRVNESDARTFLHNRLVVVVPADNPGGVESLADLARPGLRLVLAAPEVPVGQYALDFLDKAGRDAEFGDAFRDQALANVVSYEENVRSVLSKVVLGEADAGIVYTSDVGAGSADAVRAIEIPDALNTVADYLIAPVADSAHADLARAFVDFILSPPAQAVLADYGFIPVTK